MVHDNCLVYSNRQHAKGLLGIPSHVEFRGAGSSDARVIVHRGSSQHRCSRLAAMLTRRCWEGATAEL